ALYYYQVWILQRVNQHLRLALLDRFQALSLRFHADSKVGDALFRTVQDSAMVTQLIELLFLTPVYTLARFAFSVGVMALFDVRLALLLLLSVPPFTALGFWFSRRLRLRFRRSREATSELTSRIQETLAGVKVIKAYGAEATEQRRFEAASRAAFAAAFEARGLLATYLGALFLVAGGAMASPWRRSASRSGTSASSTTPRPASTTAPGSSASCSAPGAARRTWRSASTACSRCSTSSPRGGTQRTRSRVRRCAAGRAS